MTLGDTERLPDSEEIDYAFEELTLDEEFDLAALVRDPIRDYNLSRPESELFSGLGSADSAAAVHAWNQVLEGRLESYLGRRGLPDRSLCSKERGGRIAGRGVDCCSSRVNVPGERVSQVHRRSDGAEPAFSPRNSTKSIFGWRPTSKDSAFGR